jgi:hypothetical protein
VPRIAKATIIPVVEFDGVISSLQQKTGVRLAMRFNRFAAERADITAFQPIHNKSDLGILELRQHVETPIAVTEDQCRTSTVTGYQLAADQFKLSPNTWFRGRLKPWLQPARDAFQLDRPRENGEHSRGTASTSSMVYLHPIAANYDGGGLGFAGPEQA